MIFQISFFSCPFNTIPSGYLHEYLHSQKTLLKLKKDRGLLVFFLLFFLARKHFVQVSILDEDGLWKENVGVKIKNMNDLPNSDYMQPKSDAFCFTGQFLRFKGDFISIICNTIPAPLLDKRAFTTLSVRMSLYLSVFHNFRIFQLKDLLILRSFGSF